MDGPQADHGRAGTAGTADEREKRLTIRLPERLRAGLQDRAARDRRSLNTYLVLLFERHLGGGE